MYKKIVLIIMTVFLIIGCNLFKKDEADDTDKTIDLVLKSKPVSENADTTAYFRYGASKGTMGEKEFLYSYTLSQVLGTVATIIYKYPESGGNGPNCEAEFKKLTNGSSYIFKVKAYNPENGSYSNELSYEFKIKYDYKFSYGIVSDSNDLYGESSGILKKGQTFKVYATLINSDTTVTDTLLKSTTATLKLDLSDFSGAKLSTDYKVEQSFEVNSTVGAVWEITAPTATVSGTINFEVVKTPYYNVSNVPVIDSSKAITIQSETRTPGTLTLSSFTLGADSAVIGGSCSVTLSLKNEGDTSVVLSTAKLLIYDGLYNDISSQWSTTDSLNGVVIPGNTTITKTVTYNISASSDLGDTYVVFSGAGNESVSKDEIKFESEQKTVFLTSQ